VPPIYNQDDTQRVDGVSIGAVGTLAPGWQVIGNFADLDTALESQNPATNGNRLSLTPASSGSLWMTYELPRGLRIGAGARHNGRAYINAANTIIVPKYSVADALVEYEVNRNLSLRFNVYNLADTHYVRSVNNNGGRYDPGSPRSILLTPNVRF
jgi:catecholate siderophore receptor